MLCFYLNLAEYRYKQFGQKFCYDHGRDITFNIYPINKRHKYPWNKLKTLPGVRQESDKYSPRSFQDVFRNLSNILRGIHR